MPFIRRNNRVNATLVDDCLVCRPVNHLHRITVPSAHKHSCFSWWWSHSRPKQVEIDKYTKNKLCTNLVLFTRLYRDARSTSSEIRHYVSEISSAFLFVLLEGHSGPLTAINVEVKMSTYTDNYKWQSHTPPNTAKHLGTTQDAKLRCKPYVKKTREELGLKYMGRRSCLSIHSKLMLYKQISKPMWTHGIQLWGCTKQSNTDIIQRFQNKVLKTSLMHLGISETPTTIGTFKWRWLRMKLESSLRRKASPSRQRRIDPAARRQWTSAKA